MFQVILVLRMALADTYSGRTNPPFRAHTAGSNAPRNPAWHRETIREPHNCSSESQFGSKWVFKVWDMSTFPLMLNLFKVVGKE